jgi:hypothetical protein
MAERSQIVGNIVYGEELRPVNLFYLFGRG